MTGPRCITLGAGPVKRLWVNKNHLPQFGGTDPKSPAWFVECEGTKHRGFQVCIVGPSVAHFDPTQPSEGPHAWVETTSEVLVYQAVEEAA